MHDLQLPTGGWRRSLHSIVVKAPVAVALAVANLLVFLVVLLPALLLLLLQWLLAFLRSKNWKQEDDDKTPCNPPLPEDVMRRPDPCIYSQTYLAAQGLPVTWNNPDIWVARAASPGTVEPDSYHLQANTDYVVTVQVHNASTDAATGVKVRLVYRPWSFNSPDLLPVEVNAGGNEVVKFVNVAGMGAATASFNWHTPPAAPGDTLHFCLQAHVSHPLDINLENNMGQENTDVHGSAASSGRVRPGDLVDVDVPVLNHGNKTARVAFTADTYRLDDQPKFELRLTRNVGIERWPAVRMLTNAGWSLWQRPDIAHDHGHDHEGRASTGSYLDRWQVRGGRRTRRRVVRKRYAGHDALRKQLLATDVSIPKGMGFEIVGQRDRQVTIAGGATGTVPVRITVPVDAPAGQQYSVNVVARRTDGILLGGVTLLMEVGS